MNRLEADKGSYALGIETAFSTISVCVFDKHAGLPIVTEELKLAKGHAEALPILLAKVLREIEKDIERLKEICVSIGPGSFTGTRIGIAAAKALAVVLDIPVFGVSTTSAFAAPFAGAGSPVISAVSAGHDRIYIECFDASGRSASKISIVDVVEAVRNMPNHETIVTGTGAEDFLREAMIRGGNVRLEGRMDSPGADWIAQVCTKAGALLPPRPLYLSNNYGSSIEVRS